MSDLTEKVARAFFGEDGLPLRGYHHRQAKAAVAVVIKELSDLPIDEASRLSILRWANEKGVSVDDPD